MTPEKLELVPQKKTRKGTPKTKNGCLTCKIRHVKCDLARPSCLPCTRTGRTCDFLTPLVIRSRPPRTLSTKRQTSSRSSPTPVPLLPKDKDEFSCPSNQIVAPISMLTSARLPSPLLSNSSEAVHFEYFCRVCIQDFSGYFDEPFWNTMIPRAAYSEPAIMHAAVAVAALYRSQVESTSDRAALKQFALSKYVLAVKTLNQQLNRDSARVAILAAFLFMAYETFQGNDKGGLTHYEGAYAFFNSIQERDRKQGLEEISSSSTESLSDVPDDLSGLEASFTRLDIQASTFAKPYIAKPHILPRTPTRFTTIREARNSLDTILANMHYVLDQAHNDIGQVRTPPLTKPSASSIQIVRDILKAWEIIFQAFISDYAIDSLSTSVLVLKIQHCSAQIYLDAFYTTTQISYDDFHPQFTKIIEMAEAVVSNDGAKSSSRATLLPRFSFDIGIIQPLYFVGLRCRDGIMRRRVQKVLNGLEKEGVWDGKAMAAVIGWVISVEEGDDGNGIGFVSENKRLHDVALGFNRAEKTVKIVGLRKGSTSDVEWEYENGIVGW